MNLAEHLDKQLEFNLWANRTLADALIAANMTDGKVYNVYCHILASEMVWAARCLELPVLAQTWEVYQPESLRMISIDNYNVLSGIVLENGDDLTQIITYNNSAGIPFETPLHEVIQHILLHGAYHRGQVNAQLRASGHQPARIDYIIYQREGFKQLVQMLTD